MRANLARVRWVSATLPVGHHLRWNGLTGRREPAEG